ncbi:membrane hypothetical protein [metagenome]|uniref:Glycosyltransferase RgtA/B/C/D-like domain-containing protein n=1 Tax=metagenome TaxID=256318 RepID=A0A2P2BW29_9ZZZZ
MSRPPLAASGRRPFLIALAALLLVQLAWALVVPAFRGVDEIEHAYRAASVAEGHWRPDYRAPVDGRGDLIPVREDIVVAANPVCTWLGYNGPDNCRGAEDAGNGEVLVASAAARYNPVFYWVIGSVAKPFDGFAALYVMRAVGALICALLIAAAAALTWRWSSTVWPGVALVAVASPILTYSTMVAAPNGVELSAAVLLWTAGLGLSVTRSPDLERRLLLAAGVAAVCLASVRSLGPLWLGLIGLTGLWLIGGDQCRSLVRRHRRLVLLVVAATAVALLWGAWWTLTAHPNNPASDSDASPGSAWAQLPRAVPLWVLQSIGAFPLRNEPAPLATYLLFLVLWVALVVVGLRLGPRGPLLFVAGVSLAIPTVLTLISYQQIGVAWQGRYGYPVSMGVFLLAGCALDRARAAPARGAPIALATCLVAGVGCLVAQLSVRALVLSDNVNPSAQVASAWLVVLLTVAGYALVATGLHRRAVDRSVRTE